MTSYPSKQQQFQSRSGTLRFVGPKGYQHPQCHLRFTHVLKGRPRCETRALREVSEMSNYERYERELQTGKLQWGDFAERMGERSVEIGGFLVGVIDIPP